MIELGACSASKDSGVDAILKRMNLIWDDVLAVGDGVTDIELLRRARVSAASANAPQAVQQAAGEVTLSNNREGVALLIRKYYPASNHRLDLDHR
jgi:hydroxymethylpyrimidine pyrophosphatase-like HAD family hydrolase